jgi:amidase
MGFVYAVAMNEITFKPARKLAGLLRARKLSAVELMKAYIAQIERVNPQVNAIVTFLPEEALKEAKRLDARRARAKSNDGFGPLAGLPIAYKDMLVTKGIRTTFGSPIYTDNVPGEDHAVVERLKAAGVITLGKTNTPEFAAGSQTFNPIFGATKNPYDLTKTCGGSSGGAAVAVACGMLPFADGSDLGGSLRNPGNYNNVVGFRPTPGRTPYYPAIDTWATMSVIGPIARSVEDAAFLLAAMAGPDSRTPVSITEPGAKFAKPLGRSFKKTRVAWWPQLGSRLRGNDGTDVIPVDPRVTEVLEKQRKVFENLGCIVEEANPDLSGADEVFHVLRALSFVQRYAELMKKHRDKMKQTVLWNIEEGLKLEPQRIARAMALRSDIYRRMREFMERYEFLMLPVNQVPPFPVTQPYVDTINGVKLGNYIDWMKTCYYITVTSHPAISVPAGFTSDDPPLPVGLQIVGRYRDDFGVLQMAHAFEQETQVAKRRPPL